MQSCKLIYSTLLCTGLLFNCSNQSPQTNKAPAAGGLDESSGAAPTPTPTSSSRLPGSAAPADNALACATSSTPNVKPGDSVTLTWKNVGSADELTFATQDNIGVIDDGTTNSTGVFTAPDTFDKEQTIKVTATASGKTASCSVKLVSSAFVATTSDDSSAAGDAVSSAGDMSTSTAVDTSADDAAPDMQSCKALKGAKKAQCKKEVRKARKAAKKKI